MNDDLIRRSAVRRLMNHMACATIYADELEAIPSVTPDGYARGFAAGIEAAAPEPVALVEALRAFDPQAIGHGQSTDLIALHAAQQKARAAIAKWEAANA